MRLLERLTTLARADAHGVVDALEDRALVLQQHLREARAELERKRCRLEALGAEDQDLEAESAAVAERLGALEADVELALAAEKDELARYSVRKLLGERHALGEIGRRREAIGRERAELEPRLVEQEAEFQRLEQRVRGHLAEREKGEGRAGYGVCVVSEEDVELELLRRRETSAEGGA